MHLRRRRYRAEGLVGLVDRPRSGRPTVLERRTVERILLLTTERVPVEATHWSTRLMARYAGVTQWQVRQVWRAADLKPHRLKTFKLSRDPQFAEKVIDVVGLYLNPPDNALVLSVDEKTQIQALDRTHPMLPLRPGQIARRTHDYKRHGTTNLYAAFNVATGEVLGRVTRRHRATEFRQFLAQIQRATPPDVALHLIVDNSSRHTTEAIRDFLAAHPRRLRRHHSGPAHLSRRSRSGSNRMTLRLTHRQPPRRGGASGWTSAGRSVCCGGRGLSGWKRLDETWASEYEAPNRGAGADENVLQRAVALVAGILERRAVYRGHGRRSGPGASHPVG